VHPLLFWKITERSSSSSSLPSLSVSLMLCSTARRPSLARSRADSYPRRFNPTTWPSSSLPTARSTPAGFSPPCHVVPPSPEAATSRCLSPVAVPARPCPSCSHSTSRSLPRLHLHSHALAIRFLGFFFARHRCHSSAAGSAHRRQPPLSPHTHNSVLHQHHYTPLKLSNQFFSTPSHAHH
jgi:hypothetical protein